MLKTRRVSVDFDKASLKQFVDYIRAATGINIVVMRHRIEKDGGDPDSLEITLKVNDVRVIDVLRLVVETHEGMGLAVKGNVLLVTSKKHARGKPVRGSRVRDASDTLRSPPRRPAGGR